MNFLKPTKVYTAATNVEAHLIVDLLDSQGIPAFVEEDQSGVSLWALGTISQFHQPNVWVDEVTAQAAAEFIQGFEEQRRRRNNPAEGSAQLTAKCEKCGESTSFPVSQNGSTQVCRHCGAYVDVGELGWKEDFGDESLS